MALPHDMEGAMRIICLLGASAFAAQAASAESVRAETCRKGDDVRTIEVVSPGTVGLACDVVYSRDGGANVAVPYNANVDQDFCRARAAELAVNLTAEGFDCATSASHAIEASLAGGAGAVDPADAPLNQQLKQFDLADDAAAATPPPVQAAESTPPADSEPAVIASADRPGALEQPQAIDPAQVATVEPAADAAIDKPEPAEPIQLAADARVSEYRAPKPPRAKGPGRLVGAQPSIEDIIDVSTAPAAAKKPAPARAPSAGATPGRSANEIIRGVLAANEAAWNEGNLDAFMGGYVNSADLLMVKDAVVSTGWRDVKKSFEQDIAANAGMGRLSFEDVEVSLTAPDVATVVGRYALARGGAQTGGVMTLVMKQIDGRWRVVQDTRVANSAPKP